MIRMGLYSEDHELQKLLSSSLRDEYLLITESTEEGVDDLVSSGGCDVLLIDLDPRYDSQNCRIACSKRLVTSAVPTVVVAVDRLHNVALELVELGAAGYCRKPPSLIELRTILQRVQEKLLRRQQPKNGHHPVEATTHCDRMIGTSPQMMKVYELVRRVASLDASVLVTGESGTGKELIASAIHNLGSRASRPFVAVSCGAIPDTLIEAELFGYERGAFTGSVGTRIGHLEHAADGTLFLDEIGELSLGTQVKLLRVLQQREFSRLGSNRLIPLRARLVFATHADPVELIAQGKFRQDLYYRIDVMRIEAPPLQERLEDIPYLAMHFLRRYSLAYQRPLQEIHPEAMAFLQSYSWPGNVRELENVMQRAIIVSAGKTLRAEDLPQNLRDESIDNATYLRPGGSFERQLREYKVRLAVAAVRDANGNKTLAARSLRISRPYLHRLIRQADPEPMISGEEEIGTV